MRIKHNSNREILEDLYINQELSMKKIAEKFNVCPATILDWLKKFNVKIRSKSEALNGEKNPMYGRCHTEETKRKLSEARKGEKNPMYGKHLSEETKKKISKGRLGKYHSEETKRKMSEARKGEKCYFYGKHHSEEYKRKMREINKGKNNPYWRGGVRLSNIRHTCKRRQLGFKPLNQPFENCEGHHLQDRETVIYIPKELHRRIYHNNWKSINMNTIDALALYYLELQILEG
jgi:predicted DNA-binding protein YlxM (UPF0122 family)